MPPRLPTACPRALRTGLFRATATAICLALLTMPPALAEEAAPAADSGGLSENAGAFLAARVAESRNDFGEAARWYAQAIVTDGANPQLLAGAIYANLALGQVDLAADIADALPEGAEATPLANFARIARLGAAEDYQGIIDAAKAGTKLGSRLTDDLLLAWAEMGLGNSTGATAIFDELGKTPGLEAFGLYHKALALALAGDFDGANTILTGEAAGPIAVLRSGLIAHVQILSQLERNKDALDMLDRNFGPDTTDPQIVALKARLTAGEPIPFDAIRTARDGMAEVFFTVASALRGDSDLSFVLIHSQIATHLRPDFTDAILTSAGLLERMGRHQLAVETYQRIKPDEPSFFAAEMGRAEALFDGGQKDAGIEALKALARSQPQMVVVQTGLGDLLRRAERCAEAVPAYDAALALVPEPDEAHWALFFSRGICAEQTKDWTRAEADFRKALALNPGQPQVLNYLGYSFVDRGENLDEALKLIEEAVDAQPDAGYIIDSLAWAYFRLGRFEDALEPMERASVLEPVDPVVTDHLGDVYWAVGRQMEARFQWRRALSFGPTDEDAARIRRKLELGLDAVRAEEGAPPIVLKNAGDAAAQPGADGG